MKGLVQGVGFRPFIYRLAAQHSLAGRIDNTDSGVMITIEGEEADIKRFHERIVTEPPPASRIREVFSSERKINGFSSFIISESRDEGRDITEIAPDIAVCDECLSDLEKDPGRINYPLVNCTNCGPRFTIVEGFPYDRAKTSMRDFPMCESCREEYENPMNRRFHAQPVACNNCGPVFMFTGEDHITTDINLIADLAAARITGGKSVAVKGTGGYHLLCNASDNDAVGRLRLAKQRDAKPFAVMFRDLAALEEYCVARPPEIREVTSWRRPVVILESRKELAPGVSNGLGTYGAILPYMPFHYLLFSRLEAPAIVFTSGNFSDDPVVTGDEAARSLLMPVAGAIVSYDRKIVNRCDDSVTRIIDGKSIVIRRSRGYVPSPVYLPVDAEGIVSLGAEQKNTFCIGKGRQAILSQHIGDLKTETTLNFLKESLSRFGDIFRFTPSAVACDMHPGYVSSSLAAGMADSMGIPLVKVQHHHAHIVACMAEHHLDEEVIGVSLDGTGYGTDGKIWGGEFLLCTHGDFRRVAHFDYVPMPGGDRAVEEPWRMAFSYLYRYFGEKIDYSSFGCFRDSVNYEIPLLSEMIRKDVNCPLSSGAGRLFDAVASILGLCNISSFDSEAPMRLESVACEGVDEYYPFDVAEVILFDRTLEAIIHDLSRESRNVISSKFHNTVARVIAGVCRRIREGSTAAKVVLSGGVFQNRYLHEKTVSLLRGDGFNVYTGMEVPVNDGGISLGQLVAASKILEKCV